MNPEIKAKWVEALRSGKYQQGRNQLRTPTVSGGNAYCCLGVLCEIAGIGFEENDTPTDAVAFGSYDPIRKVGRISTPQTSNLINLNDNGSSFAEIADYIEANL